jgi:hypothetical protein
MRREKGSGAPKGASNQCPRPRTQVDAVCATHLPARRAPQISARSAQPACIGARSPSGASLRHSPGRSQPALAQLQNRVSRDKPRRGVLPALSDLPRLNALRVDRSFCRSTGDPEPPGGGVTSPARGHRSRSISRPSPVTSPNERDSRFVAETGTDVKEKVTPHNRLANPQLLRQNGKGTRYRRIRT